MSQPGQTPPRLPAKGSASPAAPSKHCPPGPEQPGQAPPHLPLLLCSPSGSLGPSTSRPLAWQGLCSKARLDSFLLPTWLFGASCPHPHYRLHGAPWGQLSTPSQQTPWGPPILSTGSGRPGHQTQDRPSPTTPFPGGCLRLQRCLWGSPGPAPSWAESRPGPPANPSAPMKPKDCAGGAARALQPSSAHFPGHAPRNRTPLSWTRHPPFTGNESQTKLKAYQTDVKHPQGATAPLPGP